MPPAVSTLPPPPPQAPPTSSVTWAAPHQPAGRGGGLDKAPVCRARGPRDNDSLLGPRGASTSGGGGVGALPQPWHRQARGGDGGGWGQREPPSLGAQRLGSQFRLGPALPVGPWGKMPGFFGSTS